MHAIIRSVMLKLTYFCRADYHLSSKTVKIMSLRLKVLVQFFKICTSICESSLESTKMGKLYVVMDEVYYIFDRLV